MCYKGKCLFCIPVEHGCLVFAVISAIVTLIALLACAVSGIVIIAGIVFVSSTIDRDPNMNMPWNYEEKHAATNALVAGGVGVGIFTLIMSLPSLIAFIFSVILCKGICKRKPGKVKAYFIYGVVITVLAVVAAILQMVYGYDRQTGLYALLGCAVYSLCLWMVYETYLKLSAGAVYKDHIRLVENC